MRESIGPTLASEPALCGRGSGGEALEPEDLGMAGMSQVRGQLKPVIQASARAARALDRIYGEDGTEGVG